MEKEIFEQPQALEKHHARALLRGRQHRPLRRPQPDARRAPPDRPLHVLRVRDGAPRLPRRRAPDRALRPRARGGRLRLGVPVPQRPRWTPRPSSSSSASRGETIDTLAALREAKRKGVPGPSDQQCRRLGRSRARRTAASTSTWAPRSGSPPRRRSRPQLLLGAMVGPLRVPPLRDMSFNDGVDYVNALRSAPGARPKDAPACPAHQGHRQALRPLHGLPVPRPPLPLPHRSGRGRSSSRRSPTSTPRAIPPPR